MRIWGMDVDREAAELAVIEDGLLRRAGRIRLHRPELERFAAELGADDVVVLEATGNSQAVARVLRRFAGRVAIANPLQVRAIAHAKVKTDKIDAAVLAQLFAAGFLPEVWMADEMTEARRRQVTRRNQIVRQRTRLKNTIQSILHAHLVPRCPATDLLGRKGRAWLATQDLPADERQAIERHLRELDRLADDLAAIDRDLAESALTDPRVRRLMTITGMNAVCALGICAAIGDIQRFATPQQLVSYFGLNPSVRQSGGHPAHHGHITKQGRVHARTLLVEAGWVAARCPGPLRAFFLRVSARRGPHIAAVATARKLAVTVWHMLTREQDYLWHQPSLVARKQRTLELKAGQPARRGQRGIAQAYNDASVRAREQEIAAQAEEAYRRFAATWQAKPRATKSPPPATPQAG